MLYNICILRTDELDIVTIPDHVQENRRNVNVLQRARQNTGIYKRNAIMERLSNLRE